MPIQPIDLQTLFVKMNQVGKELAAAKQAAVVNQAVQGQELVQDQKHKDHSVSKTQEAASNPSKVREDEEKQNAHEEEHKESTGKDQEDSSKKRPVYEDPDLGSNIDISG